MISRLRSSRSTILAVALAALLPARAPAQAPAAAPEALIQAWAAAFNECSAEKLAALYHPQATLWGTNAGALTTSPEGIRVYFEGACAMRPPVRVTVGQVVGRLHGGAATVSGTYDFAREGSAIRARYSMALVAGADGAWRIVQHHSSVLPGRP